MRVLVIDDDDGFRDFTLTALEAAGIERLGAASGEEGLKLLEDGTARDLDLILLDVEMPGPSGWDFLIELRERSNDVPVIYVTARESLEERVKGLRLGADDYVVKPVEYEELIARIHAVVRRRNALAPITFGDLHLDLAKRRVLRADTLVDLSPREYDLLLALVRADTGVMSREDLLREVWGIDFDVGTNVVDVHIGRLRRKLDRYGHPVIETVRGEGYRANRREPQ